MFAIVKNGGKQYKLEAGRVVRLERMGNTVGEEVELGGVILASDGTSLLDSSKVAIKGRVTSNTRGRKIKVFKTKKRSAGLRNTKGHRQSYTYVLVDSITEK